MNHASIATVQCFIRQEASTSQIKRLERHFLRPVQQCILNQRPIVSDLNVQIPSPSAVFPRLAPTAKKKLSGAL